MIKRYTVRLEPTGHYTLSLILDVPNDELLPKTGKTIGIDLGLTHLAILSNGDKYETFKATYNESQAIKWQSKMSRRMHDAKNKIAVAKHHKALVVPELSDFKNWQKAQQLKARHQGKVANKRLDYLHKLTTDLVRTYDVIAIEKLASQRMLKHKPLAKSISNASWAQFRTLLAYKCERYGKRLIEVDPAYTSQDCSTCGHRDGKKRLSIRYWTCSNCGSHHDRDVNAAKNIESRGLAQL